MLIKDYQSPPVQLKASRKNILFFSPPQITCVSVRALTLWHLPHWSPATSWLLIGPKTLPLPFHVFALATPFLMYRYVQCISSSFSYVIQSIDYEETSVRKLRNCSSTEWLHTSRTIRSSFKTEDPGSWPGREEKHILNVDLWNALSNPWNNFKLNYDYLWLIMTQYVFVFRVTYLFFFLMCATSQRALQQLLCVGRRGTCVTSPGQTCLQRLSRSLRVEGATLRSKTRR